MLIVVSLLAIVVVIFIMFNEYKKMKLKNETIENFVDDNMSNLIDNRCVEENINFETTNIYDLEKEFLTFKQYISTMLTVNIPYSTQIQDKNSQENEDLSNYLSTISEEDTE
jgi:hypothetical protein